MIQKLLLIYMTGGASQDESDVWVRGGERPKASLLGRSYARGRKAPLLGRDEALLSNTFISPSNGVRLRSVLRMRVGE